LAVELHDDASSAPDRIDLEARDGCVDLGKQQVRGLA